MSILTERFQDKVQRALRLINENTQETVIDLTPVGEENTKGDTENPDFSYDLVQAIGDMTLYAGDGMYYTETDVDFNTSSNNNPEYDDFYMVEVEIHLEETPSEVTVSDDNQNIFYGVDIESYFSVDADLTISDIDLTDMLIDIKHSFQSVVYKGIKYTATDVELASIGNSSILVTYSMVENEI